MGALICLPAELVGLIVSFLPNRDIKNLRLTCPTLGQMAQLRLSRVFLSANPLNIEVFRAIADHEEFRHNIVEIIWDDARLIEHAPERRLDLLDADGQFSRDQRWSSFRSGLLKSALTAASSDLKHFNLQINVNYEKARHFNWPPDHPFDPEDFVPLKTILPTISEKWKKLQHFGLSGLLVRGDELLSVLADLPASIRSVELSHLEFLDRNPNAYHDLLVGIRDTLRWGEREVHKRPVLTVHHKGENSFNMLYSCYDKAVNDFVYHGGLDPFRRLIIHQPIPYRLINPFDTNSNPNAPLETLE
ncbi:hypothetical protein TCE0_060r18676 [Talaromyces pinophilus]|uniref:F-box domain-containing protein n=1 Tax=Talaromyces pinophilus TaxID=128442 RepID=A0A6V8HNT5_TALPI|nr:hypothetical protein TCE0_060r18676 [Talaromyces pinophilus]